MVMTQGEWGSFFGEQALIMHVDAGEDDYRAA